MQRDEVRGQAMLEHVSSRCDLALPLLGIERADDGEVLMDCQLPPLAPQAFGMGAPAAVRGLDLNVAAMAGVGARKWPGRGGRANRGRSGRRG